MRFFLALAFVSAVAACGGDGGAASFGGMTQPNVTTVPAGSESTAVEASTSTTTFEGSTVASDAASAGSTSTGTSEGTVWDMGMPDFGSTQPAGCGGKIDFLFVVSSGGGMYLRQEQLLAAFPDF